VKFNVGQLCVDVKWKQTESYLGDIKYVIIKVLGLEGKLQKKKGEKNTRESNTAYIM